MSEIKEIKTRISLDGETKFKASLKSVDSQLRVLASQTKAVAATFTASNATVKNYTDLNKALSAQITQQKVKVSALSTAVSDCKTSLENAKKNAAKMAEEFGANSEQAKNAEKAVEGAERTLQKYQTQLGNAQAALNKLNLQYKQNETALKQLQEQENKEKSDKSSSEKLEKAKSALNVLKQLSQISFDALSSSIGAVSNALAKITSSSISSLTNEVKLSAQAFTEYEKIVGQTALNLTKASTSIGMDFEAKMSKVQAISGIDKASGDYDRLSKAAQDAGAATSKTAAECADALSYLSLAGYDTDDKLSALMPIIQASEAGGIDLATTTSLITDSMASLGLGVSDLDNYLNLVTKTQNSTNTSMQQMMEAYIQCGGMFKELNVPMNESATILGALANQGAKGAEAGHKMNSILVNLIGANKNAKTAMTELGVSAWDDNGNFIGLTNTLQKLGGALDGLTAEELTNFEAKIGGKLQLNTLQKLIAGVGDGYDELSEKIADHNGVLAETAETMLDNTKGAFTILTSALQGTGVDIYTTLFADVFTENIKKITDYVNILKDAFDDGGFEQVGNVFSGLKFRISSDIEEIIPKFTEFYSSYHEMFNNIALTMLDVSIDTAPTFLNDIIPMMTDSFSVIVNGIANRVDEIIPILAENGHKFIYGLMNGVSSALVTVSTTLPETIEQILPIISTTIEQVLPTLVDSGFMIVNSLLSSIETIAKNDSLSSAISRTLKKISSSITENLPLILTSGTNIVTSLLDGIIQNIPLITSFIDSIIPVVTDTIMQLADYIAQNSYIFIDSAVHILGTIGTAIMDNLPLLLQDAQNIIDYLGTAIIDNLPALISAAVDIVLSLVEFVAENIELIVDAAVVIVDTLLIELTKQENLSRLIDGAVAIVENLAVGIANNLDEILSAVAEAIFSIVAWLLDPENLVDIVSSAAEIIGAITRGILDSSDAVFQATDTLCDEIGKIITETDWADIGEQIINGIVSGFMPEDVQFDIKDYCDNIVDYWHMGLQIGSPSKRMRDEVGVYLVPGMVEGIDETSEQLNDSINNVVGQIQLDKNTASSLGLEFSDYYQVSFSSNIDEIQQQLNEIGDKSARVNLFSSYTSDDIQAISKNTDIQSNDNQSLNAIYRKLSDIEEKISNVKLQIPITNYLYPNSNALRDTVVEIMLVNDAVTGGR